MIVAAIGAEDSLGGAGSLRDGARCERTGPGSTGSSSRASARGDRCVAAERATWDRRLGSARRAADPSTTEKRREAFERLITAAAAGDGTVAATSCPYPLHELLTYLVVERGLLLHGSNTTDIEQLEPQPARDFETELRRSSPATTASGRSSSPRSRGRTWTGVFNACLHIGRGRRLRRFYLFVITADPAAATTWTDGAVYAMRARRVPARVGKRVGEPGPVRPVLRVLVRPEDFPLRHVVVGVSSAGRASSFRPTPAGGKTRAPPAVALSSAA